MDVAAAAQRAGRVGGGNVHGVQILDSPLKGHHPAAMMKIILPLRIRPLGAMNKHIALLGWMHGYHAHVRALRGTINGLHSTAVYVHSLNGFAGKRCAGRTNVEYQPLAVGSPGINIGKLVMTGSKSDLFHDDTLMRDLRIRVAYRKKLAYTFHIADQQDIRQRAY